MMKLHFHPLSPASQPVLLFCADAHHARVPEVAQAATIAWGREKAERMLSVLDRHLIGKSDYLTGDDLSIADYFGSPILAVGELIGMKLDRFPNVDRWMTRLMSRPTWRKIHEPSSGLAASLATKQFVSIN